MSRPIRRIAPLAVAVLSAAVLAAPAASGAASTTTCKLSAAKARHLGPTYVATPEGQARFSVVGTSCASGEKVIKAFHACRLKKGKEGRCTTKVLGYSCTDKRPAALRSPLSFDGDVTCRSAAKRVTHHYTQNT
jgi:hypothetical protein